jgi:glycosyltransferase involved in cell wall biosynthesis
MVKILYVITGLGTGGGERMLYNLLSKLNRDRFSPIVVSLIDRGTWGDRIEALEIPVHTLGMKQGVSTLVAFLQLTQLVRKFKPDLIQGWMYHGNLASQLTSFFSSESIPILWNIQNSVYALSHEKKLTAAIIKLGALLSNSPKKVIFVSQISKVQHEALGYCRKNSCLIPNASDNSQFIPSSEARLSVRKELSLSEQSFLIGLVCRYHPMKDHANFLQASALLLKSHPDIHFLMIGTEVNRENQDLYQLVEKLNIVERTHLLGERRDIPRLTAALDIATSASAYGEAFPLVLAEAMSCGVPCAVTNVGDSGWIVGNAGKVVPPKNPQALADAWKEIIDLDLEARTALGKAARERIVEKFSLNLVVSQYEALYEDILLKN